MFLVLFFGEFVGGFVYFFVWWIYWGVGREGWGVIRLGRDRGLYGVGWEFGIG